MYKYWILFLIPLFFFSFFSISFASAEEVLSLIEETEQNLERINVRLQLLENLQLGNGQNDDLVVSVPEIKIKVEESYILLDQAVLLYNEQLFDDALGFALEAKENSDLAVFYLDALLRDARRFNLSELLLQGDLSDLLDLRNLLRINELIVFPEEEIVPPPTQETQPVLPQPEENLLPEENESGVIDQDENGNLGGEEESINNGSPDVDDAENDPRLVCLENQLADCTEGFNSCVAGRDEPVSSCDQVYTATFSRCQNIVSNSQNRAPVVRLIGNILGGACSNFVEVRYGACQRQYDNRVRSYERYLVNCEDRAGRCVNQAQNSCSRVR